MRIALYNYAKLRWAYWLLLLPISGGGSRRALLRFSRYDAEIQIALLYLWIRWDKEGVHIK